MPRAHILQFKKHCPVVWANSQTCGSFFEEVPFWVEFKICLHTFQCLGLGTVSVGKTAPSSQSTELYCLRDILCHSVSHGLIINIYTFSKWICCANKHWWFCLLFQYFMSGMQKLDCTVTGNTILFSSIDLEFRTMEKSKTNITIALF